MTVPNFQWRSIKAKVTLLTLAALVAGLWSLAWFANRTLHESMRKQLAEQQRSTVSLMADQFDDELRHRIQALETIAALLPPNLSGDAASLQSSLAQHPLLQTLFNGGTFITRADGTAVASLPTGALRVGLNYLDQGHVAAALTQGRATISQVHIGKALKQPVFSIAVPVRNAQGQVLGALVGVIDLAKANFLDHAISSRYGETGGYLLIAPQQRMIISASDRGRAMETLPAPGINPAIDRFLQGYEGTAVVLTPLGAEVLATAKGIAAAGWYVVVALPTEEAFAPLKSTQAQLLWAAIGLTLLLGSVIWWLLRQQLQPLQTTASRLAALADAKQAAQPLPIRRQDEIGQLIGSFNRMLGTLKEREDALRVSDSKLKFLVSASPVTLYTCAPTAPYGASYISPNVTRSMGYTPEQFTQDAEFWAANIHPDDRPHVFEEMPQLFDRGEHAHEYRFRVHDGSYRWMRDELRLVRDETGEVAQIVGYWADITQAKQAQAALLQSEERYRTAFRTSPDAININRLSDGLYLDVNDGFLDLTGFTRDEVIGKTSQELNIWRNAQDRQRLIEALQRDGFCSNLEVDFVLKDGSVKTALMSAQVLTLEGVPTILSITRDISERKRSEQLIEDLAYSDPLTGLPNRRQLIVLLQQALDTSSRRHRLCALLLVDLDDFKALNDTLGHHQGDRVLEQVAKRLTRCVPAGDAVARLGGDEFVVLLENLSTDAREAAGLAQAVAETILAALNQGYSIDNSTHYSSASIGIALFGEHAESVDEPLIRADLALFQAKAAGRHTLRFFDPAMQSAVNTRVAMEAALREAIATNQFSLHFQAQVTDRGQITGAEALLRWQDPQRGMVLPAEFIPMAEQTGLILPIGYWVLETACQQLAQWAAQPAMAHLTLAVNVSAQQFHQKDFVDRVLLALERTGANAHQLKLELTESLLIANIEAVIVKMGALKARGIGFSLDDFGTGYSSLTYLKRLPLYQIKIDQCFVRDILQDPDDAAIAKAVIALAGSMGLAVMAEGVETEAQRSFLAELGCPHYQGYLFSGPLPIKEFNALAVRAR